MVGHSDVVIALLGVSAGLSGFVLVFLGLIVATLQGFGGATPTKVLSKYRKVAAWLLATFGVGMICLALAVAWLIERNDNQCLYIATISAFFVQLAALISATVASARRIVWG